MQLFISGIAQVDISSAILALFAVLTIILAGSIIEITYKVLK